MIQRLELRLARIASLYAPEARFLAVLRIVFGIWIIAFPTDLTWVSQVPVEFFNPRPGAFALLSSTPGEPVILVVTVAKLVFAAMVMIGIWTLPASVGLSLALIASSGISYSFSKVDHFILFELAPVFLAFAGWGYTWSLDAILRSKRGRAIPSVRGVPVLLFAMTIGWAMLSAAVPKVSGGWLDPSREAARGYVARDVALGEKTGPFALQLLEIDSNALWKFLDYATLVAEGGLLLVVFFPLFFRLWLILIIGFHIGVYLALGINFADNLLAYAVFFSPVWTWMTKMLPILRKPRNEDAMHEPSFVEPELRRS